MDCHPSPSPADAATPDAAPPRFLSPHTSANLRAQRGAENAMNGFAQCQDLRAVTKKTSLVAVTLLVAVAGPFDPLAPSLALSR